MDRQVRGGCESDAYEGGPVEKCEGSRVRCDCGLVCWPPNRHPIVRVRYGLAETHNVSHTRRYGVLSCT